MPRLTTDIWRSVFRHGWPRSVKERALAIISNLFLHVHPPFVRRRTLRGRTTLGLGVIAVALVVLLTGTGVLLMLYYTPTPEVAYRSIQDLRYAVPFGRLMRNLHRWSAHGLVIVAFLHMCRVYLTGAHLAPRQFNWVIGVVLLLLVVALSFTGYLLPWDQLAFWATTVGTTLASYVPGIGDELQFVLLGGHGVGAGALLRFYVLHCAILPALLFTLVAVHIWRVRKDGGLAAPAAARPASAGGTAPLGLMVVVERPAIARGQAPEDTLPAWPGLLLRELALGLAVVAGFMALAIWLDAPLRELADPANTPNPARAPWFLAGVQELAHYSALFGGVIAPGILTAVVLALPYLERGTEGAGHWVHGSRRAWCIGFGAFVLATVVATVLGAVLRGPNWKLVWPW